MAGKDAPGPDPQLDKRARYVRLIALGLNNSEACRLVGINRRTGTRWRFGRTVVVEGGRVRHYPAVPIPVRRELGCRYLSEEERTVIADLRRTGTTLRAIGEELGRSPATISRELRRNLDPVSGKYRPAKAHQLAARRRGQRRGRRLDRDPALRCFVQAKLAERWSPEQISHELQGEFAGERFKQLTPESIYQAVYDTGCRLIRDRGYTLRSRRRRRRQRRRPDKRRAGGLPQPMVMITDRPASALDRAEPGHWEGDFIVGLGHASAIGTLVERTSRYVILVHVGDGRHSLSLRDSLIEVFTALPPGMAKTLTWDQGKEMSAHLDFTKATGIGVYFCAKASPWQRGSNENMNGLLRDYFPKRTNLRVHTPADLQAVAAQLNTRPRKTLQWRKPAELFAFHATPSDTFLAPQTGTVPALQIASAPLAVLRP